MLRYLSSFVALTTLALTGLACGGAPDEAVDSSTSNLTENVEESGIDAQVLQIWTPGRLFPTATPWQGTRAGDVTIDADAGCSTVETRSWSHYVDRTVDCESAFATAAPFDVTHAAGPVMTPVRFTVSKDVSGGQMFVDPDFCSFVEVRVVVRDAASQQPSFAGVGFWTSRGEQFTAKNALQDVGHTRLANGEAATVYRFTGISTCISSAHNSTSGNEYQTFAFKPYAAFDAPNGATDTKRYRVWERINGNHVIGRSWPGSQPNIDSTGFDRQGELLAH